MAIITDKILVNTKGFTDIIDITNQVQTCVQKHNVKDGMVHVFVIGSTASVTTIEYEPGLLEDIKEALEVIAPTTKEYHHDAKWHDGNGFSHVRSALVGNSVVVPLMGGAMQLGTWQQIILLDFDNRSRARNIIVQVIS